MNKSTPTDQLGSVKGESSKGDRGFDRNRLLDLLSLSTARKGEDYKLLAQLSTLLNSAEHVNCKQWDDRDAAEINALLAEYGSLRQESMNTINNRIQTLVLGLAAVAALAGGSLASDRLTSNPLLLAIIFSIAIPLICVFVFLVWLSEAIRCHRVSYHLASAVEARINAKLGRLVVTWEAGLWTRIMPRDELGGPSMAALAVLGIFAVAAPWFGVLVAEIPIGLSGSPLYEVLGPYALYGVTVLYTFAHMRQLRNIPVVLSQMHDCGLTIGDRNRQP